MTTEETLELDISPALQSIDQIESALSDVVTKFSSEFADALGSLTIDVTANTDSLESEVTDVTSKLDEVQLQFTVDDSELASEIDQAIGSVPEPTIPVGLDVDEESIQGIGDTTKEASGSLEAFGQVATNVAVTTELTSGNVGALGGLLGNIGPQGKIAAVGLGALLAVSAELFEKASRSEQAESRFNQTLKDQASIVDQIDVGGLNKSLTELAEQVGSDDEALRNAASNIFQLGVSSGTAAPEVSKTTKEIVALAARAAALRPELGEAGDVANRLTTGLSRGGRAVAQYGISLSAAEINARALKDTGKQSATELTLYEKAAAGAAIATERLGNSLSTDLNQASQSALIQQKSLREQFENITEEIGKPILQPFLDSIRAGAPLLLILAKDFGELAAAILPIVSDLLPLLIPALESIEPPLKLVVGLLRILDAVLGSLTKKDASKGIDNTSDSLSGLGKTAEGIVSPLLLVEKVVGALPGAFERGLNQISGSDAEKKGEGLGDRFQSGLNKIKFAIDNPFQGGFFMSDDEINNAVSGQEKVAKATQDATAKAEQQKEANEALQQSFDGTVDAIDPLNSQFKQLGVHGTDIVNAFIDGKVSLEDYKKFIDETGSSFEYLSQVQQQVDQVTKTFLSNLEGGLTGLQDALDDINAGDSLDSFIKNFTQKVNDSALFIENIRKLIARGADDLAQALAEQGISASGIAAEAVRLSQSQLSKREQQIEQGKSKEKENKDAIDEIGRQFIKNDSDLTDVVKKQTEERIAARDKELAKQKQQLAEQAELKRRQLELESATSEAELKKALEKQRKIDSFIGPTLNPKIDSGKSDKQKKIDGFVGSSLAPTPQPVLVPAFAPTSAFQTVVPGTAGGNPIGGSTVNADKIFGEVNFNNNADPKQVFAEAAFQFTEGSIAPS